MLQGKLTGHTIYTEQQLPTIVQSYTTGYYISVLLLLYTSLEPVENLIPRFGLPSTSRSIKRRGPVLMSSINTYDLFDVRRRNDFFERETFVAYSFITRMATRHAMPF